MPILHSILIFQNNANGQRLKDMIVENLIVKEALEYIQLHAPQIKTLLA